MQISRKGQLKRSKRNAKSEYRKLIFFFCLIFKQVLAKLHGVNPDSIVRLADLQFSLNKTLPEMASIVKLYLHDDPYNKDEVAKLLDMTEAELDTNILSENTRSVSAFKLQQRALHVFEGELIFFILSIAFFLTRTCINRSKSGVAVS